MELKGNSFILTEIEKNLFGFEVYSFDVKESLLMSDIMKKLLDDKIEMRAQLTSLTPQKNVQLDLNEQFGQEIEVMRLAYQTALKYAEDHDTK